MTEPPGGAPYYAGGDPNQPRPYQGPQHQQPSMPYQPMPYSTGAYPTHSLGPVQVRPLDGLATALTIMLGIAGAAALIGAFPFFNRVGAINDYLDGSLSLTDLGDLGDADDTVLTMLTVNFLLTVGTGVVFIIWHFRLAQNAQELRGPLSLGPGWAIGGWFIPFANFVLPHLQIRQSVRASDPDLPSGEPAARGRVPGIVTAWTVLFISGTALMAIGVAMRRNPDQYTYAGDAAVRDFAESFANGDRVAGFSMLVTAAAAVVAILMVRAVTERQAAAVGVMQGRSR